eukprot:7354-Heterococcus_DN1.PRE.4
MKLAVALQAAAVASIGNNKILKALGKGVSAALYAELHALASVVLAYCDVAACVCTLVCELIYVSQHATCGAYGVLY